MRWQRALMATGVSILVAAGTSAASVAHSDRGPSSQYAAESALSQPADGGKQKRKRFKRFFNFRLTGDGCLPSMSEEEARIPRFILFGARTPGDNPLDPNGSTFTGWEVFVCLPGFDPSRQLTVRVTRPDGQLVERVMPAQGRDGLHGFTWLVEPGMPLGRYLLEAVQGAARAQGSLTVGPATRPVINGRNLGVRVGERLRLFFTGFAAGERVRVGLYRSQERGRCPGQRRLRGDYMPYCFTGHVFTVKVDAGGNRLVEIVARRRTYRPDNYALKAFAPSVRDVIHGPQFEVCARQTTRRDCRSNFAPDPSTLP